MSFGLNEFKLDVAQHIEHTLLNPTLSIRDIDRLVEETRQHHFFGVCVPPFWVRRARREIGSSPVSLATVAGFPLGHSMTETKLDEIKRAMENGADEIDVMWNLTAFKTGIPWTKIEIAKCSRLVHDQQKILKVIIETGYLTEGEIIDACKMCADAGADFVRTSTGFGPNNTDLDQIKKMRIALPQDVGIHVYTEIQSLAQASEMIEAGANRIGTASAIHLVQSTPQQPIIHE